MQADQVNYRLFSAEDVPRQSHATAAPDPLVSRFAVKLAEAMGRTLLENESGIWRVTLDRIEPNAGGIWEETGSWFRLESQRGSLRMHAALDRAAVAAICDVAMGGSASEQAYDFQGRPLSGIETDLLRHVLTNVRETVTNVLSEELAMPVGQFDSREDDEPGHKVNVVGFHFLVNFQSYSGEARLTAFQHELDAQFAASASDTAESTWQDERMADIQRRIATVDFTFGVVLGPETKTVEDIAALTPGRLFHLSSNASTPVTLECDGIPVFTASLSRTGERLSVSILKAVA